jgi:hypothetical protein
LSKKYEIFDIKIIPLESSFEGLFETQDRKSAGKEKS